MHPTFFYFLPRMLTFSSSSSVYSPVDCCHVSHCRGPANPKRGVQLAAVHRGNDNRHGLAAVRHPLQIRKTLLTRISFGYDSAFIGTTIARQSFVDAFNIVESEAADISSNITSTFQAGAFFGAIFCFLCELSIYYSSLVWLIKC